MLEFRLLLLVAIGLPSLILALWHGSVWENKNPEKLGFKWGYFVIYNTLINNMLLFGFFTFSGIDEAEIGLFLFGIVALSASAALAYFSIQRKRWALVTSTILSLNPLWMIVNIAYLRNRWPEFRAECSSDGKQPVGERLKSLPREMRMAIFASIAWLVCVPSYVFLFEPYGRYMRDDDVTHMIGVMLVPVIIGFGLFMIYRKFVR